MDIRKLQRAIVDGLEDVKAQDIRVFNTEHLSPLFERVIIASGTSNRQTKSLASSVRVAVKAAGLEVLRTEGEDNGEWIIVDCGAAVAHIMQPAIRDYYRLEEIWGGKPVKMKLGSDKVGLVKASSAEDEDDEPAPALRKTAARKASTAATAAGQSALGGAKAVKPAAKSAAKTTVKAAPVKAKSSKLAARAVEPEVAPAPRRPSAPRKVSTGTTTAAKTTAAKSAAAKPAARKTTTVKGVTPKSTTVKTIVVKPAVKRTAGTKAAPAKKAATKRSAG
jgi:ribosome-associated protein